MPVPPECASLEAEVNQLTQRIDDWPRDDHGRPRPGLALLVNQLAQKKASLVTCIAQHAPGYRTEVSVLDLTQGGSTVTLPVQGLLWDLAPVINSQNLLETHSVQAGTISFAHTGAPAPGRFIGVSINDGPNALFLGPLFRSGPLPALPPGSPGNPGGLIGVVIPDPPLPVSVTTINSMLPAVGTVLPTTPPVTVIAPAPAMVLSPGTPGTPGTATLTLSGTVPVPIPVVGPVLVPFLFTVTFTITPAGDMNVVTRICDVTVTRPGTLTTTGGGLLGLYFSLVAPLLAPAVTSMIVTFIRDSVLNPAILTAVAGSFPGGMLPAGVVVSMRRIMVLPTGIRFFPSLGAFGGL